MKLSEMATSISQYVEESKQSNPRRQVIANEYLYRAPLCPCGACYERYQFPGEEPLFVKPRKQHKTSGQSTPVNSRSTSPERRDGWGHGFFSSLLHRRQDDTMSIASSLDLVKNAGDMAGAAEEATK